VTYFPTAKLAGCHLFTEIPRFINLVPVCELVYKKVWDHTIDLRKN